MHHPLARRRHNRWLESETSLGFKQPAPQRKLAVLRVSDDSPAESSSTRSLVPPCTLGKRSPRTISIPALPQNPSAGEYVETRGYRPADDRCKIVPCYTSFDPRGGK